MIKDEIGMNAGRIWHLLNVKNQSTIQDLKNEVKLKDNEFYMALGWLAREGNIEFDKKDGKQIIYWIF